MQKQQANFKTFIVFWLSQTVSQLGSAMTGCALVLWVYGQTNSALPVSLLALCSYAPYVLVSVFAGGFVDRHRKKSIMLCADTVAFLCTLLIAALLLLNRLSVPWIFLVNAITGFMNAFQSPASVHLRFCCIFGFTHAGCVPDEYVWHCVGVAGGCGNFPFCGGRVAFLHPHSRRRCGEPGAKARV